MALNFNKVNYTDGSTIITAANLNAIQDALLYLDEHKSESDDYGCRITVDGNNHRMSIAFGGGAYVIEDVTT